MLEPLLHHSKRQIKRSGTSIAATGRPLPTVIKRHRSLSALEKPRSELVWLEPLERAANTTNRGPPEPALPHPSLGVKKLYFGQVKLTWALALLCLALVVFTVYFAYNCSRMHPISRWLLFSKPQRTLLALNILSHSTIFFLGILTDDLFENTRWAFAVSRRGIAALCFLALSPATSYLGVMILLLRSISLRLTGLRWGAPSHDSYHFWGIQRYRM